MIFILIAVLGALMLLTASYLLIIPNFFAQVEKDFMRRAESNAYVYCLKYGELAYRAKTLTADSPQNKKNISLGFLKKRADTEVDTLKCEITVEQPNKDLSIDLSHEFK